MRRADDSSCPYSLLTTTLYDPDSSIDAEVMVSFISRPLKEIMMSFDALTTVESLEKKKKGSVLNDESKDFLEKEKLSEWGMPNAKNIIIQLLLQKVLMVLRINEQ